MTPATIERAAIDTLLRESEVFGSLDAAALEGLASEFEVRSFGPGEFVIRQGDAADGLYLVASGRLRVTYSEEDGTTVLLGEEGRGNLTGEMSLISDAARSADVQAIRESHLLFLPTAGFERVVSDHPHALRHITSALIRKLATTARGGLNTSPARNVVILPLGPEVDSAEFGRRLVPALARAVGSARMVTEAEIGEDIGADHDDFTRATWFESVEGTTGVALYVADPNGGPWTEACLRRADLVLRVAAASSSPEIRSVERLLATTSSVTRTELVLLHEPSVANPRGTKRWLEGRGIDRHHHVRRDRQADHDRVVRLLMGCAIGVVFGGGGARGIAHVGVLRALEDFGIPIDAVGGTSIGSIIAGAATRQLSPEGTAAMLREALVDGRSPVDLTFPALSLATGARVTERIQHGADGLDLEDTWINFFCVSTNLTKGRVETHTNGPGWMAIPRASRCQESSPRFRTKQGTCSSTAGCSTTSRFGSCVMPMPESRSSRSTSARSGSRCRRRSPRPASSPDGDISGRSFGAGPSATLPAFLGS